MRILWNYWNLKHFGGCRMVFAVKNRPIKAEWIQLLMSLFIMIASTRSYSAQVWFDVQGHVRMLDLVVFGQKDSLGLISECLSVRWIEWSQSEFPKLITIRFDHFWQFVCLLMCFVSLFSTFSHKLKCDSNFIFISN